ncbi:unnamed protein product, partial [Cuscuta campestris]
DIDELLYDPKWRILLFLHAPANLEVTIEFLCSLRFLNDGEEVKSAAEVTSTTKVTFTLMGRLLNLTVADLGWLIGLYTLHETRSLAFANLPDQLDPEFDAKKFWQAHGHGRFHSGASLARNWARPSWRILHHSTCVECKIWIFWKDTYSIDLLTNEDQVVFVKATQLSSCRNSVIAFVYAKTKSWLRKDLWNSLVQFAQSHDNATPWAVKAWGVNVTGPPMFQLYAKLKATMLALSKWNKEVFGNIFLKLEELEANVQEAEEVYQQENSDENLLKLKAITAQYTHQLHLEEMFWKQKAHIQWIEGGDRNSKITDEDNQQLVASPSLEEVKDAVFSLNPNSAAGPDGFTGHFFQKCWDIIHLEIFAMVSFLCWRVHLRKLPLDTILYRFGHSFPSKCYCCTKPDRESTEHVFAQGDVARAVWNYFCDLF